MNKFFLFLLFLCIGGDKLSLLAMDYNSSELNAKLSALQNLYLSDIVLRELGKYIREQKNGDRDFEHEVLSEATRIIQQNPLQFITMPSAELYELVMDSLLRTILYAVKNLQNELKNIQRETRTMAGHVNTLILQQNQMVTPIESLSVNAPSNPYNYVIPRFTEEMGEESLLCEFMLGNDNDETEQTDTINLVVALSQTEKYSDDKGAYNPFNI